MAQQPQSSPAIKILSVVWYKVLPAEYGGQKAVAHFNEHLGRLAPLVMLCSKANVPEAASYSVLPLLPTSKLQFINPLVWRTIYRVAKREKATHLIIEFPYHGIAGWLCRRLLGIRLIVNTHNIESLRFKQQKKWWWSLLYVYERWTLRIADAVFFKTRVDESAAQKRFRLTSGKLLVVPYGVSKPAAKPGAKASVRERHEILPGYHLLLFAGTLDYTPNAEAVAALFEKLTPLLDQKKLSYQILITGRNRHKAYQYLHGHTHPAITFVGEVAEMKNYFAAADAFVSPVLSGGGIQTKLMDALAAGLNVVCFASKAASITNTGDKLLAVADADWPAFAAAIIKACGSKHPTPVAFYETYDWRSIAAAALQKLTHNA